MSDSDSVELTQPGCSDFESGPPGNLSSSPQLYHRNSDLNVHRFSADIRTPCESLSLGDSFGLHTFTRSAHYKGNRGGHEEAESCKGKEFLESPTPMATQRSTPPTLSCHREWLPGRGRGSGGGMGVRPKNSTYSIFKH